MKPDRSPARLLPVASALIAGMAGAPAMAGTVAAVPGKVDAYLGEWNYDQPDRESMRNIAEIGCLDTQPGCESPIPGAPAGTPMRIPQIGRIVFTKEAGGKVVGRTDRGCTWRFTAQRDYLQLDPPSQRCVNRVINSSYTITRWSVTVSGRHERETIDGISHHPNGDYRFLLQHGARTKVRTEPWIKAARRFTGRWEYVPADPSRLINIVVHRTGRQSGRSEQRGVVDMVVQPDRTIAARTSDGCRWTLAARGNTAELDPPGQVCRRPGETVTLDFWQVASDGEHQASIMNGTVRRDGVTSAFLLNVGALSRR